MRGPGTPPFWRTRNDAGGREIVGKKEGEQKGSARGSVHWGCYYATALDIEWDP